MQCFVFSRMIMVHHECQQCFISVQATALEGLVSRSTLNWIIVCLRFLHLNTVSAWFLNNGLVDSCWSSANIETFLNSLLRWKFCSESFPAIRSFFPPSSRRSDTVFLHYNCWLTDIFHNSTTTTSDHNSKFLVPEIALQKLKYNFHVSSAHFAFWLHWISSSH